MTRNLVVIGAGMASGRMVEALFDGGFHGHVTLFNAEPRGNYNRLMLSPVLSGEKTYAQIVTHDDDWYAQKGVTCRFGEPVVKIDRDRKVVVSMRGETRWSSPPGRPRSSSRYRARICPASAPTVTLRIPTR